MGVAAGTPDSQTQPDGSGCLHPVEAGFHTELFLIGAAFGICQCLTMESRRQLLISRGLRQKVAGKLLDGELIKRKIPIDGINDPVAPAPGVGAGTVFLVPVRIRIPSHVEPVSTPPLSEMWRLQ